jgi:hypothetical protein
MSAKQPVPSPKEGGNVPPPPVPKLDKATRELEAQEKLKNQAWYPSGEDFREA